MRRLAESLESSSLALAHNDAEAIARGAAHQAELCRQWSRLEDELRRASPPAFAPAASGGLSRSFTEAAHSARLQAEWETLGARIRYLTRVHWSLLRHLERSLAVLNSRGGQLRAHLHARSRLARERSPAAGLESNHVGFDRIAFDCLERACGQPAGDGTTSNNVANANTPGYPREVSV